MSNVDTRYFVAGSRGLSLVEFMVAMLLSTVLIGGAISIYLASQRSYVEAERSMVLGDSGRFAKMVLTESLRHAGFAAGIRGNDVDDDPALATVVGDCAGQAAAYDLTTMIFAATVDGSGGALNCITDGLPNTDVLVLKSMLPFPYSDTNPNDPLDPNHPANGLITYPEPLEAGTTFILSNGSSGLLIDGAEAAINPPNVSDGETYARANAWPYEYQVFYVRDPNAPGNENLVAPSLSRKVLRWDGVASAMEMQTEDLAEGIEHMRLRFGIDSNLDGEVDSYGSLADVTDWAALTSVEAYLLARSLDEDFSYEDQKTYQLADLPIDPNEDQEQYSRRLVRAAVTLRNPQIFLSGGY